MKYYIPAFWSRRGAKMFFVLLGLPSQVNSCPICENLTFLICFLKSKKIRTRTIKAIFLNFPNGTKFQWPIYFLILRNLVF